jgi:hypothetical protein
VRGTLERVAAAVAGTRVPLDVWVDTGGRARRIVLVLTRGDNATVRVQQDLYDFAA